MFFLSQKSVYKTVAEVSLPVTVAEVKAYLRLNTGDTEDALLTALISSAVGYIQDTCSVQFLPATWRAAFNRSAHSSKTLFPDFWEVALRPSPVSAVNSIQYQIGGVLTTWPTTEYAVSLSRRRPVVRPKTLWPSIDYFALDPLVVTYTAGFANAAAVPELWKTAVKALVGHWYENREGSSEKSVQMIPVQLQAILSSMEHH